MRGQRLLSLTSLNDKINFDPTAGPIKKYVAVLVLSMIVDHQLMVNQDGLVPALLPPVGKQEENAREAYLPE